MLYLNQWEIADAVADFDHDPVLGPAARTLRNLAEWTNANSDGWAYWPKPCRAAAKLQKLLQDNHPYRRAPGAPAVTVAEYQVAVRPIKAFRTRQGASFKIEEVLV